MADAKDEKAQAPAAAPAKPVMAMTQRGLEIKTLDDATRFAKGFVDAGLAPEGDTPAAVLMKLEMGMELGFPPMAALQQVVNVYGRLSLQGAGMLALIRQTRVGKFVPGFEGERDASGEWTDDAQGYVDVERDGVAARVTFSVFDAKAAGLWNRKSRKGNPGPWTYYQKDMLIWKAVARASKLYFSDVTNGLDVAEAAIEEVPTHDSRGPEEAPSKAVVRPQVMSAESIRVAATVTEARDDAPAGSSLATAPAQDAPAAQPAPAGATQEAEVVLVDPETPSEAPSAPQGQPADDDEPDDRSEADRKLGALFG